MIRIALCDDDRSFLTLFAKLLTDSFHRQNQAVEIDCFCSGKDLIARVEKGKSYYQVIFLDVEMPDVNGFVVAQRLKELDSAFLLIFTTYMEHQSRKGYVYGAFRYLFKNNLEAEVEEAVAALLVTLHYSGSLEEFVTLKQKTLGVLEDLTLRKSDILYLKAERSRRVTLCTPYAQYELLVKPLSEYAKILNPAVFVPILRCYLLNFSVVEGIDQDNFVLRGGQRIPLGSKRISQKASMEKYMKYLKERL